ncbi:MAG: hypothetical protein AB7N24_21930 [Dehalococcoidia bacterium]
MDHSRPLFRFSVAVGDEMWICYPYTLMGEITYRHAKDDMLETIEICLCGGKRLQIRGVGLLRVFKGLSQHTVEELRVGVGAPPSKLPTVLSLELIHDSPEPTHGHSEAQTPSTRKPLRNIDELYIPSM